MTFSKISLIHHLRRTKPHARAHLRHRGTTELIARHLRTRTLRTPPPPPLSRPCSVQPSTVARPQFRSPNVVGPEPTRPALALES